MKKSLIFFSENYKDIEKRLLQLLNNQSEFLSVRTAQSPRAVGDAIENILVENFGKILGTLVKEYSSSFARRAMADLAFTDKDDFYYVVDVKTHRLDTKFNMPNLTSVERLARFYEDDKNYFVVLNVAYNIEGSAARVKKFPLFRLSFCHGIALRLARSGGVKFRSPIQTAS